MRTATLRYGHLTRLAPTTRGDQASRRLTIEVRDGALFALLPAMLARALATHDYEPGMEVFVDCRRLQHAPDSTTIHMLAEALSESRDIRGPVALLTADECMFGMGRMLEILVGMDGDLNVRVFDDASELESWLRQTAVA